VSAITTTLVHPLGNFRIIGQKLFPPGQAFVYSRCKFGMVRQKRIPLCLTLCPACFPFSPVLLQALSYFGVVSQKRIPLCLTLCPACFPFSPALLQALSYFGVVSQKLFPPGQAFFQ
jgi:hypothetical protein